MKLDKIEVGKIYYDRHFNFPWKLTEMYETVVESGYVYTICTVQNLKTDVIQFYHITAFRYDFYDPQLMETE